MNTTFQLFVYGSLRKGFGHPVFSYISQYFNFAGPAKVKGRLYDLGDYPAAIPTDDEAFIIGELYVARQNDEFGYAIAQLDDYEGINPGEEATAQYRRELAQVQTEWGVVTAWVYWFSGSVEGCPIIQSGDIISYMKTH